MMMTRRKKSGGGDEMIAGGKVVIVAIKASKEIPKAGLMWALAHVAQPGDCIKLLVVIPSRSSGKKMRVFARFAADCTTGQHHWYAPGMGLDGKDEITNLCSQMMHELQDVHDPDKVKVRLKIVSEDPCGVVASEAKKTRSSWVILDRRLKHEKAKCVDELQCNLVVMDRSKAKVVRLNLVGSPSRCATESFMSCAERDSTSEEITMRGPLVTPATSPDHESPVTLTDVRTSSISSSDRGNSPYLLSEVEKRLKEQFSESICLDQKVEESDPDTDSECLAPPSASWAEDGFSPSDEVVRFSEEESPKALLFNYEALLCEITKLDREIDDRMNVRLDLHLSQNVREAVSLLRNGPPSPPPLCSQCQHKAPVFGNPPRWFSYSELELATDGFSRKNFLAEGGYGSVHSGTLSDGQVVAVKQHKLASSQGDVEFCAEVEVLSCAQHRNLVTLIGFCVEDGRRLLVYEFICNGSLDLHLYGSTRDPLVWSARRRIAIGAARGLRYLHEECRVGCIVHRDLRPNNILLTHDFEPLVGDFGLARWQPDGETGVDTRVIGTFGYLAPEYAQSGQITDKADVYSFGVILVELVTGRKAMDINRPKGQQCLTEWARPLLGKCAISDIIDPKLRGSYSEREVQRMLRCASLCIRRDHAEASRVSGYAPRLSFGESQLVLKIGLSGVWG